MKAHDAINKIKEMLNLSFKKESFATTSLEDGTEVTNNLDSDFMIGQVLYVVGESTLTPAPAGTHTTREGYKITVDAESVIVAIESSVSDAEKETTDETTGCINYGWLIGSTHNFAISASQNRKFVSQFRVWADIVLTLRNITSDHPMVALMKQRQMRYDVIIVM